MGVSLLGGKSERTCVAVLEYFPVHGKVFLHHLFEKIQGDRKISADTALLNLLDEFAQDAEAVGVDVPLQIPMCLRCKLKCPGVEACKVEAIRYMREIQDGIFKENKNAKYFTPYTQRPVELHIQRNLERPYYLQDALGANLAPLTARLHHLKSRRNFSWVEVFPELSYVRLGEQLELPPKFLKQEGRAFEQDEARQVFLTSLLNRRLCFIYQQDIQRLIDNGDAFDAFLSAFTAFLGAVGECEKPPKDFPSSETWIQFPKTRVSWETLFK